MLEFERFERRKSLRVRCSAGEERANVLGVTVSAISMTDAIYYSDYLLTSASGRSSMLRT
jgi:hypothetical protein